MIRVDAALRISIILVFLSVNTIIGYSLKSVKSKTGSIVCVQIVILADIMILSKVRAKASFTVSVEIARLLHLMLFRIDNKVFNKLFLTFITKFIPSLSKVLLILQIF
jgi:hypothetical protein